MNNKKSVTSLAMIKKNNETIELIRASAKIANIFTNYFAIIEENLAIKID